MESSRTLVKIFLFLFFFTAFASESIRVMSFNILIDEDKAHRWEERKAKVASMIRFHHADLVGLQEASERQLKVYLHGVLSDTFDGEFPSDHLPVVADLSFLRKILKE